MRGSGCYQIFGRETFESLIPVAAEIDFARAGLPEPPPWKREQGYEAPEPGFRTAEWVCVVSRSCRS